MNEEIKHALEVCERVMNHACEVGDSEWSVYSGFREAREAIKAAQQSVQRTCFYCDEIKEPAKEAICQSCVDLLSDASR